jgi:hypothetical protein
MFEREIAPEDVEAALVYGIVIEDYPNDLPYPSKLILVHKKNRPIHVVVGNDFENERIFIITVYNPDSELWGDDFMKRRN